MGKKQFLAALMLTVLLTGCGGSGKAAATQKDPVQVQTGYTAEMEQDANTDSINDAAVSVSSVDEKNRPPCRMKAVPIRKKQIYERLCPVTGTPFSRW
jgi:hypothetical protein